MVDLLLGSIMLRLQSLHNGFFLNVLEVAAAFGHTGYSNDQAQRMSRRVLNEPLLDAVRADARALGELHRRRVPSLARR